MCECVYARRWKGKQEGLWKWFLDGTKMKADDEAVGGRALEEDGPMNGTELPAAGRADEFTQAMFVCLCLSVCLY